MFNGQQVLRVQMGRATGNPLVKGTESRTGHLNAQSSAPHA